MRLSYLVKDAAPVWERTLVPADIPGQDPDITSIHCRADEVVPGGLFIAIKGFQVDGHDYIDQAVENGAAAVVAEKYVRTQIKRVQVKDTRKAMACIAARFYNFPASRLVLTGITGTNGKTTTSWILESIFKAAGFKTGVIGTVNLRYDGKVFNTPVTTPESLDIQRILWDMAAVGVTHVIIEVSSHGIDLKRVNNCAFDLAVFTNLSQDHLDYHKTMKKYFKCKKKFFTNILDKGEKQGIAVINADDENGENLFKAVKSEKYQVSSVKNADIYCRDGVKGINGISGTIYAGKTSFSFQSGLTGKFNLENILCAAGAAWALGVFCEHIKLGINQCNLVPGRLEKLENSGGRHVFVDYAHTPDALASILKSLRQMSKARLIVVFGCGGDRDTTKRPLMGQIASRYSDTAIVTSDNPRSEDPLVIIEDILRGMDTDKDYIVEPDRKKALEKALALSEPEDIVVAAGKGHETYQILKHETIDFDDRIVLRNAALALFKGDTQNCAKTETSEMKQGSSTSGTPEISDNPYAQAPIPWTCEDIRKALEIGDIQGGKTNTPLFSDVSTDSRTMAKDGLFVAIKGEHFDGHRFIPSLADKGIKGFVAEKKYISNLSCQEKNKFDCLGCRFFPVENTLAALGSLARFQRCRSKAKIVAITGSNGKTSTREMTGEIFKTRFNTLVTANNFNNEIGLPITLLKLSPAHEWAVVEMGMNHKGEIARLSAIAEPDIALVTNTAEAHLEGLGTRRDVAEAKAEIFGSVRKNGYAIINYDDPERETLAVKAKENKNIKSIFYFGRSEHAGFRAETERIFESKICFDLVCKDNEKIPISLNIPAGFMALNAVAAASCAFLADIPENLVQKGLAAFKPVPGRLNILRAAGLNIINDTYNANPDSVKAALLTLKMISKDRPSLAALGDMLELGEKSQALHREIGQKAAQAGISRLYGYGPLAVHLIAGAIDAGMPTDRTMTGTREEIAEDILKNLSDNAWLLLKGSRGMKMEKILCELQQRMK
ncbi:MAG: UDP-N-acetylmuramoyl-L-alanyl-D-glutamate--2,6-diaminopimelate ligase [Desulfobacteraceae bacterium]